MKDGSLNNVTFLTNDFDRALYFYKYKLNTTGQNFNIVNSIKNIHCNSAVIVSDNIMKEALKSSYNVIVLDSLQSAYKFEVKGLK